VKVRESLLAWARASRPPSNGAYGSRKAGTHSPSSRRPGSLSTDFVSDLARSGFPLLTEVINPPGAIEVYPHPALIELMKSRERLAYKATKIRQYWPELAPNERRERLLSTWQQITVRLADELDGVECALPSVSINSSARELKAFEDILDAMVCVWVGTRALAGRAKSYGDKSAAIWIPSNETGATVKT
jgi:predicted RNase H-like nuclease